MYYSYFALLSLYIILNLYRFLKIVTSITFSSSYFISFSFLFCTTFLPFSVSRFFLLSFFLLQAHIFHVVVTVFNQMNSYHFYRQYILSYFFTISNLMNINQFKTNLTLTFSVFYCFF